MTGECAGVGFNFFNFSTTGLAARASLSLSGLRYNIWCKDVKMDKLIDIWIGI